MCDRYPPCIGRPLSLLKPISVRLSVQTPTGTEPNEKVVVKSIEAVYSFLFIWGFLYANRNHAYTIERACSFSSFVFVVDNEEVSEQLPSSVQFWSSVQRKNLDEVECIVILINILDHHPRPAIVAGFKSSLCARGACMLKLLTSNCLQSLFIFAIFETAWN